MSYDLAFHPAALDEWRKLDSSVKSQLKKKLAERLNHPRVPSAKLHGHPDRYKIKLRRTGYRLVYEVRDTEMIVIVIAIGKRERSSVYFDAENRSAE